MTWPAWVDWAWTAAELAVGLAGLAAAFLRPANKGE
jgi:hypothetical protein